MGLKSALSIPYASYVYRKVRQSRMHALDCQQAVFRDLIARGRNTAFGKAAGFASIRSHADFKKKVPLTDYEGFKPWIERIASGESNVLWPGKPIYLTKTSGTTSGVKFIPISVESISNHINSARNALLLYIHETGNASFVERKMLFLSGSPVLQETAGIKTGRLSGIVNHHIPSYLRRNQVPGFETNSMEDWESKIEKIVDETISTDLGLISGIPPWVQMYYDRLERRSGKTAGELFPNLSLYVYGGVNYEPYRSRLESSLGRRLDTLETYPASEGFIAYQDTREEPGLMLIVDEGIFYEFVLADQVDQPGAERLGLQDVIIGQNYAIILNTNAGLWAYVIGDTVRFVSLDPYRIVVTGRIKHYISAFGEHVIGEEVDHAIQEATRLHRAEVTEFTVAPRVNAELAGELPYHEWFIEFENEPHDMRSFALEIDRSLQASNTYYRDLIAGMVLQPLKIRTLEKDSFIRLMRSEGKLGGQNKVPRLSNDRELAEKLSNYITQV